MRPRSISAVNAAFARSVRWACGDKTKLLCANVRHCSMWRGIGAPAAHGAAHDTLKAVRSNRDLVQEEQIREQPDDGGGAGREARARDDVAAA